MTSPVLEALNVRVDVDGVPQLDGLSFETTGERILILASPPSLFSAATGVLALRRGTLRTSGANPPFAIAQRLLASAPLDPPLPPSWKAREYVAWSARLAGHDKREAETRAAASLEKLKLTEAADGRIGLLASEAKRALVVAAALATGATTLFIEDPLRGLREEPSRALARTLIRATASLRTVVFAARTSLASPLAMDADEALVFDDGGIGSQGAPAEVASHGRSFALKLHGPVAAFARLAEQRGARVTGQGSDWTVNLGPDLQTSDLLDVAAASSTVVLELRPLGYAFG